MSKYDYLIITTKKNISEADHMNILNSYARQGFRLLKEKKHWLGGTTYTLERDISLQRVKVLVEPSLNLGKRGLLMIPDKYIYEVTEVLMKGVEASKDSLPLEIEKLLIDWISLNRADLAKKLKTQ